MSAFVYSANPDDFRIHIPNAQNVGDYVIHIKHVVFFCVAKRLPVPAQNYNTQPEEEKEHT